MQYYNKHESVPSRYSVSIFMKLKSLVEQKQHEKFQAAPQNRRNVQDKYVKGPFSPMLLEEAK